MSNSTFKPGVTLTATLRQLKRDGTLVMSITGADTLTCQIYTATGTSTGSQTSVAGGTVIGDGAGNYTTHLTAPTTAGNYEVRWVSLVNGYNGRHTFPFYVRS